MSADIIARLNSGPDPEYPNTGGGAYNADGMMLAALAARGGEYERGYPPPPPPHLGRPGDIPRENLESRSTREAFLSLFLVKVSGFKLNFESQCDMFYAMFCFNFSLYRYCSWHTK